MYFHIFLLDSINSSRSSGLIFHCPILTALISLRAMRSRTHSSVTSSFIATCRTVKYLRRSSIILTPINYCFEKPYQSLLFHILNLTFKMSTNVSAQIILLPYDIRSLGNGAAVSLTKEGGHRPLHSSSILESFW